MTGRTIILVARQARPRLRSPRSRALVGAGVLVLVAAGSVVGFLAWRGLAAPKIDHSAPRPRVAALVAGSGAAVSDGDLVPAGTPLRLTFATTMRTSTVRLLANQAPLALRWASGGVAADLDVASLRLGPVELVVPAGGRDGAGLALPPWRLAFSWIFAAPAATVPLPAPALVQVPNDASARDQAGLQSAAIVYEYLTEGGITRFTAIYTRAPDSIGPVRSGRLISFALTHRYHGLLLASGLSEGSAAVLRANPVPHVFDTGGGVFSRVGSRQPPNDLFTGGERVRQAMAGAALAAHSLERGSVPIRSGPAATTMGVPEHGSVYTFDPATWTYTKQVDGRTLADAATGQPLRIQLLVVMHTTATPTAYVEDVNGIHGLDFDMASGGRADFWFDGFQTAGRWSTRGPDSPPTFELNGGAVVTPSPLTWIDVVTT